MLDWEEAAALLNVPVPWLKRKVGQRKLPAVRLGRHVRFTMAQINQIIRAFEDPIRDTQNLYGVRPRRSRRPDAG